MTANTIRDAVMNGTKASGAIAGINASSRSTTYITARKVGLCMRNILPGEVGWLPDQEHERSECKSDAKRERTARNTSVRANSPPCNHCKEGWPSELKKLLRSLR